eukprot:jgi/Mesen1/661/ME000109S10885
MRGAVPRGPGRHVCVCGGVLWNHGGPGEPQPRPGLLAALPRPAGLHFSRYPTSPRVRKTVGRERSGHVLGASGSHSPRSRAPVPPQSRHVLQQSPPPARPAGARCVSSQLLAVAGRPVRVLIRCGAGTRVRLSYTTSLERRLRCFKYITIK